VLGVGDCRAVDLDAGGWQVLQRPLVADAGQQAVQHGVRPCCVPVASVVGLLAALPMQTDSGL
jgi:hypothetical protein